MRKLLALWAGVMLASAQSASATTLNVLPLGDSITVGQFGSGFTPGAYRSRLESAVLNRGSGIRFRGPWSNNAAPGQVSTQHAGFSGHTIGEIRNRLPSIRSHVLASDLCLLLAGTNDVNRDRGAYDALTDLEGLIYDLIDIKPNLRVVVGTVPPRRDQSRSQVLREINFGIPVLVNNLRKKGMEIGLAYTAETFTNLQTQMVDNLHPSAAGYDQMYQAWLPVMKETYTDIDGDGKLTMWDYMELSMAFDSIEGDWNWHAKADIDKDGQVTIFDYIELSSEMSAPRR